MRRRRFSRLVGRCMTGANRRAATGLMTSLRSQYSSSAAESAIKGAGIDAIVRNGAPLRVRTVRRALVIADSAAKKESAALALAGAFSRNGSNRSASAPIAAVHAPSAETSSASTRGRRPSEQSENRIATRSSGPRLTPSSDELNMMNPLHPGSVANRALATVCARFSPPLRLDVNRMTLHAKESILQQFVDVMTPESVRTLNLTSTEGMQAASEAVAQRFLNERHEARRAVKALSAHPDVKSAMLEAVTIDTIPAQLVVPLWRLRERLGKDIAALVRPQSNRELASALFRCSSGIDSALSECGLAIDDANRDTMIRHAWHFLLAIEGPDRVQALCREVQSNEPFLSETAGLARWYADEFALTEEAGRLSPGDRNRRVYPAQSFDRAEVFADVLIGLTAVLAQTIDGEPPSVADARQPEPHEVLNALRNNGVPCPTTCKFDGKFHKAPVSDAALAQVRRHFSDQFRKRGDALESGLDPDGARFLIYNDKKDNEMLKEVYGIGTGQKPQCSDLAKRAIEQFCSTGHEVLKPRYRIDGDWVDTNSKSIAVAMRDFCTDGSGNVDREMLGSISRAATFLPLETVVGICSNEHRPDLAGLYGETGGGVPLGFRNFLSRDANGDVLLEVRRVARFEAFTPAHPFEHPLGSVPSIDHATNSPARVDLDMLKSCVYTNVKMRLDETTKEPRIDDVDIIYKFTPLRSSPFERFRAAAGAPRSVRLSRTSAEAPSSDSTVSSNAATSDRNSPARSVSADAERRSPASSVSVAADRRSPASSVSVAADRRSPASSVSVAADRRSPASSVSVAADRRSLASSVSPVAERRSRAGSISPVADRRSLAGSVSVAADRRSLASSVSPVAERRSRAGSISPVADRRSLAGSVSPVAERRSRAGSISPVAERRSFASSVSPVAERRSLADSISPVAERRSLASSVSPAADRRSFASSISADAERRSLVSNASAAPARDSATSSQRSSAATPPLGDKTTADNPSARVAGPGHATNLPAGAALPATVDRRGLIALLKVEENRCANKRLSLESMEGPDKRDSLLQVLAEEGAYMLATYEVENGRDPRQPLDQKARTQQEQSKKDSPECTGTANAREFVHQAIVLGADAVPAGDGLTNPDRALLVKEWRSMHRRFSDLIDGIRRNPSSEKLTGSLPQFISVRERIQKAIINVVNGIDPRPELNEHAVQCFLRRETEVQVPAVNKLILQHDELTGQDFWRDLEF